MTFVVRCIPEPDESPAGFILRVLDANGFRRVTQVEGASDVEAAFDAFEPLASLADPRALFGMQEVEWWRRQPCALRTRGLNVHSKRRLRACPMCLDEREVRLWAWDIPELTGCPRHGCWLEDECGSCGGAVTWSNARLAHCGRCGVRLGEATPRPADTAALLLAEFLTGGENHPVGPATRPYGGAAAAAVSFFGRGLSSDVRGETMSAEAPVRAISGASDRAAAVLGDWPHGFYRWLSDRKATVPGSPHLAGFGSHLRQLRDVFDRHDEVMRCAGEYFRDHWDGLPLQATSPFARAGFPHHLMRLKDARAALSCNTRTLARLIAQGRVTGRHEQWGRRQFAVVDRTSVENCAATPIVLLTHKEAGLRLGISAPQIKLLWQASLLERDGAANQPCISEVSLVALLARLEESALLDAPEDEWISLARLPQSQLEHLPIVIERIFDGSLACYLAKGLGLHRFNVQQAALRGYRYDQGARTCSYVRAKQMLGLKDVMIKPLILAGCLAARHDANRVGKRTITLQSIEAYPQSYVGAAELARAWGTNTTTVISRLLEAGVKPVVFPLPRLGITSIWRRSDVDAAHVSRSSAVPARTKLLKTAARQRRVLTRSIHSVDLKSSDAPKEGSPTILR